MNFDTILSKRPVDQTTHVQQALRRLKYLHTSLANPKASSLKPLQTTSTPPPINGLDLPADEERDDFEDQNAVDKRCFLALSPDELREEDLKRSKLISRQRCGWRPVRKGRAPLTSPTAYFNPTFHPLSTRKKSPWDRKTRQGSIQRKTSLTTTDRKAKSAPASGGLPTLNPEQFDCVQCFANEMERLQQSEGPEFNTNIKINRVTFSARPKPKENQNKYSRASNKLISEKTFSIPQSLYGGWGVRSRRRNSQVTQKKSRNKRGSELDVTSEFQTLRIEPRSTPEGWGSSRSGQEMLLPPPPAPPTPIRQIDIKMPEGYLVQYRLQPVA